MLQKFPFADSLLKDLGVLQPEKTSSYDISTVLKLAKRFPQLDLTDSASLDKLREEFTDFCISPGDLPCIDTYRAADCTAKPCAGLFWKGVNHLRTLDGQPRFGKLDQLMAGLLSIPCSNADAERGFSILRKIHTDQRSNLNQSTIVALMSLKFNADDCYSSSFSEDLLTKCKKATCSPLKMSCVM